MRPFNSTDGRMIVPVEHVAKFNGKNNASKSKVLIFLEKNFERYFSTKDISLWTGVNYEYLTQRLSFWWKIRYVNRKAKGGDKGRPIWVYQIAERGRLFVDNRIPRDLYREYVEEMRRGKPYARAMSTL